MPSPNGWLCHVVWRCILKHHAISINDCQFLIDDLEACWKWQRFPRLVGPFFRWKFPTVFYLGVGCHLGALENRDHNRDHFNSPSCCNSSPFGGGICRGLEILTSWFWPVPIILCNWRFSASSTKTCFTSFFVSSHGKRETKTGQKRRCNERQL